MKQIADLLALLRCSIQSAHPHTRNSRRHHPARRFPAEFGSRFGEFVNLSINAPASSATDVHVWLPRRYGSRFSYLRDACANGLAGLAFKVRVSSPVSFKTERQRSTMRSRLRFVWLSAAIAAVGPHHALAQAEPLEGAAAFGDWQSDKPGVSRVIRPGDLPKPGATPSVANFPHVIQRPANAVPQVPAGFKVELFADGLTGPRELRVAPNGDIFIAETRTGRVRVLRAADDASKPSANEIFASGLNQPFGIAFFPSGNNPHGFTSPTRMASFAFTMPRAISRRPATPNWLSDYRAEAATRREIWSLRPMTGACWCLLAPEAMTRRA